MRKLLIMLFTLISFNVYASPYANPWLYDKMLDFIQNPAAYKDNFTNGIIEGNDDKTNEIFGAFAGPPAAGRLRDSAGPGNQPAGGDSAGCVRPAPGGGGGDHPLHPGGLPPGELPPAPVPKPDQPAAGLPALSAPLPAGRAL